MIFASYEFIFIFFPIVIIGYFLFSKFRSFKFQHIFLVIASLVFYSWFNISYLWIILISIVINYSVAIWMNRYTNNKSFRRFVFILGIIFNILLIGYFKYYDFFVQNINYILKEDFILKNIILPLGISFFTFQQVSFLLSIYRKEEKVSGFLEYCLFVTFFPQLVAGPIVLYNEMTPQFKDYKKRYHNWGNLAIGLYIFIIGLFKKIVIADTLAVWANNGFDHMSTIGFFAAWATAIAYTLQIYFDFSGYSDMAIGLAKMLNIDLPTNFNSPYKSKSIKEFWRRWHITLSRALSEYIYKPLGGSRKGEFRTYITIIITFFISGLWHGASWLFILWGLLHGLAMVTQRIWNKTNLKFNQYFSVLLTFLFVNITWVFFRAETFEQAFKLIKSMVFPVSFNFLEIGLLFYDGLINLPTTLCTILIVVTLVSLLIVVFKAPNSLEFAENFKTDRKTIYVTAVLFFISIICLSRVSAFIYFNF
ncbi:MBOAT family O-acyltransferase [Mesobacillus foraminis]|uniref:MBOAT family O-acyltransferase n=1 Tax=Mesobacillus foraminis TaxID=279826 RepID=UPI000EF4857F|nr:MBOAT family O-acyltransferase [Mesobacillus foraminis]